LLRPEVADDERFQNNARRVDNREALTATIETVFSSLTAEQVVQRLDAADIANAKLNDVTDLIDHPQLAARDRWAEVSSPAGPIRVLRPPVTMGGVDERMDPIPAVGEHTDAILQELGYDGAYIERLRAEGAV
jgi:crotonobetainyl-CoA:carnitine CoA-transferase CaiB-like acyl-CoA transferase